MKIYFGTNLKMCKTISETNLYVKQLESEVGDLKELELFVIPSYTALQSAVKVTDRILIGAQNMHWEERGAYTGEISPGMLQEVGVSLVMIGHSERRHLFRETEEEINKKVLSALDHGFRTLLCIGDTEEEYRNGRSGQALIRQLSMDLKGVSVKDAENIWIAYEPVWAIGEQGTPAGAEFAQSMHIIIKEWLNHEFGRDTEIPVLYGGSVNLSNAQELLSQEGIDGLFVGRSAWDPKAFHELIRKAGGYV